MEKAMKNRQKYSQEFKTQAVKLSYESSKSVPEIAKDLGIAQSALYGWHAQATHPLAVGMAQKSTGHEEELRTLREQLRIVTMERDILKKAMHVLGR